MGRASLATTGTHDVSAASYEDGLRLLCATGSPFWWHHLNEWMETSGSTLLPGHDDKVSTGFRRAFATDAALPVSILELINLNGIEPQALDGDLQAANAVALFVQGNRHQFACQFIDRLAALKKMRGYTPPLLIMAGLISEDDLDDLRTRCRRQEIPTVFQAVSALDDGLTQHHLANFILGFKPVAASPSEGDRPSPMARQPQLNLKETDVAAINETLAELLKIDGAIAVALVDSSTGMIMGKGGSGINLEAAGAGNTEVVRAKQKTMKALGISDAIEDILITLGNQYHIIRPMAAKPSVFLYLVLEKTKANLGLARFKVMELEKGLAF